MSHTRGGTKPWLGAAAIAMALTACAPKANTGFSAPVLASSATNNGATPMFLVTSNGSRVLSWVSADSGGAAGELHVLVERPGGATDASVLRDPLGGIEPHGEAPPQLAAAGAGTLYTLYTVGKDVGGRYPLNALRFSRSDDTGRNWSTPVSVNEGETFAAHSFHALIAGTGSDVYAAWLDDNPDSGGVWLRHSADGGRSWLPAQPISRLPACPCCRTALALGPDGTLYAAWREVFPGDVRDIVVAASSDKGQTWSTPVRPHVDGWVFPGCPHTGPSLKVDRGGAVHIGWWTGKPGAAGVWYARSSDGGKSWAAQPLDTAGTARPSHVQLALDQGAGVFATWDDGMAARPRILLRSSADGGTTFGEKMALSDAAVAGVFPVIAAWGDSLTVAWTQATDADYREAQMHEPNEADPNMKMALPRVGQQEVYLRRAAVRDIFRP